jgi:EamA domain-containing membrane protein RarD
MLNYETSIFLKITSGIFFLISGIVWKKVLMNGIKNYHYIFYRVVATVFFLVLASIYVQIYSHENRAIIFSAPTVVDWITCISICLFSFWGLYFYTNAMQTGRYSFVSSLQVISSVFSFFTSLLVYNETLSNSKYYALALIILGLLLHQRQKLLQFQLSKEVVLVLLCSIFWGISFVFYLVPIRKFGVLNFSIILEICVLLSCVGLLFFKEKRLVPLKIDKQSMLLCLLMGFLVAAGSLLSNFTLIQLPVSLNILIGLLFELVVLAVGLYFFREKLYTKDWLLIVFATIGGFLFLF